MSWYFNHECKEHCECDCRNQKRFGICDCFFRLFNCFGCRKPFHDKCHCDRDCDCKQKRNPWDKCIY